MATVITTVCDACLEADTETPAEPYRVAVGLPGKAVVRVLTDLCPDHAGPLTALWEALADLGREDPERPAERQAEASSADGRRLCPICGGSYKNTSSLSAHTRGVHGQTLGELSGTPLDAFPCPLCSETFGAPQGLGRHTKARHKMSVDEARAEAARAEAPPESRKSRRRAPSAAAEAAE